MARGFRRTTSGVEARLDDAEAEILDGLVVQVGELLAQDPTSGDEVLARLFPDGYRDDPEAAAELRSLTQDDLVEAKRGALDVVREGLASRTPQGRLVLADDQAEQWLTALNDVRLALGTRLGVTEEVYDATDVAARDGVEADLLDVYAWLGWLQESLVETMLASLDPPSR